MRKVLLFLAGLPLEKIAHLIIHRLLLALDELGWILDGVFMYGPLRDSQGVINLSQNIYLKDLRFF